MSSIVSRYVKSFGGIMIISGVIMIVSSFLFMIFNMITIAFTVINGGEGFPLLILITPVIQLSGLMLIVFGAIITLIKMITTK